LHLPQVVFVRASGFFFLFSVSAVMRFAHSANCGPSLALIQVR
jgi:hypothetical protein